MITGAHSIIYSKNPEADRAFLKDVLGLPHVDVGHGWLIFGLPPAEVAVHPSEKNDVHEFYLICADVDAFAARVDRARPLVLARPRPGLGAAHAGEPAGRRQARRLRAAARAAEAGLAARPKKKPARRAPARKKKAKARRAAGGARRR